MTPEAKKFFQELKPIERRAICKKSGITERWLQNVMYSQDKKCSVKVALKLEACTGGLVTRRALRPDINWDIVSG